MKTIIVMRHAKADIESNTGNDFDRQLRKKGIIAATNAAKQIHEMQIVPDVIVTSPVVRAMKTAIIIADYFELKECIFSTSYLYKRLYTFSEIVNDIIAFNNNLNTVIIIGHNPTISYLLKQIHKPSNDELRTSSGVVFDFDTDNWSDILSKKSVRRCAFERED